VPPGQPAQIAARVGELLRDADLQKRFAAAGPELMRSRFTFEAQAAAYVQLLDRVCTTRQRVNLQQTKLTVPS
jgi:hypothetical protein